MNEDHSKIQDYAKRLGLRVVPVLPGENDIPIMEESGKPHEANRGLELEGRGFKMMPPPPEWLQREMNVAHIVVALKQIKDALWAISLMLGFLVVIGFFMWAK